MAARSKKSKPAPPETGIKIPRWSPPDLKGRVIVVAGASRGAGRGVAVALGDTGATVYVAGRSTRGGWKPADGAPGTIEDTAEEITRRGGRGIPVRTDCSVAADVAALFERVSTEQGRLDGLAVATWGGDSRDWDRKQPFWEYAEPGWDGPMMAGAFAHLTCSVHAARLMAPAKRGTIACITEIEHEEFGNGSSLFWLYQGLGHRGINRMVRKMSVDLKKVNVGIYALAPGFMRTERVMAGFDNMKPEEAEKMKKMYGFDKSESTEFVGRAFASLVADPRAIRRTGKFVLAGDLAKEYNFTDVDGTAPNMYRDVMNIDPDEIESNK
jgi:Dehydrogenases with different specificities (related to short-chain alcohol dehydrogenases)